ncbi:MAG: hypothetical protein EHM21_01080 [Chloroflexi bacterium]|nr:MAG: hypothetical protein EHM21_01080 [Chloroflexota bacterium]
MPDTRLDFRYTRPDVVSAQRTRFLRSKQLRIILIIWAASSLILMVPMILPEVIQSAPFSSWGLVFQISLAYAVTLFVLIIITPFFDFYLNRFWRLPLTLQYSEKRLRLTVTGKPGGLRLNWNQLTQVDESGRTFILHYGDGGKFFVLPKSAFSNPEDERRFRELLAQRALVKEKPGDEEISEEEN